MNRPLCLLILFGSLAAARPASALPLISVGTHNLRPNRAGQPIQIFVSGGDQVPGLNLVVQVGDGGAFSGGDDTGPVITGLNVVTGTIFAANNTGQRAAADGPLFWEATTTTNSGTVSAQGLLATVIIDTTGFTTGSFALSVMPPQFRSDFATVAADITDGSIRIFSFDSPWRNQVMALDVNADTFIDATDVLQIVNDLNELGARDLPLSFDSSDGPPPFLDVNGDTLVSAVDVLQVINFINERSLQNPSGASMTQLSATPISAAATSAVPEPSTLALGAAALFGFLGCAWRRRAR